MTATGTPGPRRRRMRRVAAGIGIVGVVAVSTAAGIALSDDGPGATGTPRSTIDVASPTTTDGSASRVGRRCRAPLTTSDPLRLWIAGDSLAFSVGNGLGRQAANTGVVAPVYESHVSSGLSSPSFFDWPRRVAQELPRLDPEIVVLVMGTNDWVVPQATPVDSSGRPAWQARYERSVQTMVDAIASDGRTLYWVGPPVLSERAKESGARQIASLVARVVERNPDAVFVDAHALLDDEDGGYTGSIEINGRTVQVRAGDGVHLTNEGADYLGSAVFALIDRQCRVRSQAIAGHSQPLVETEGSTSHGAVPTTTTTTADASTTSSTRPTTSSSSATSSTTKKKSSTSTTAPPTTTTAKPATPTTKQ